MLHRFRPLGFGLFFSLVAGAAVAPAPAQSAAAPAAATAGPPLSPRAAGYYEFELGKLDELQGEDKGDNALIASALQHYTAAMAADPAASFIATRKADLLSRTGHTSDAVALVQGVLAQHPDNLDAETMLAQIYLRQLNDVTEANAPAAFAQTIAAYQKLVQLEPLNADHHVMLGKLYGVQRQFPAAEQQFRTAIQMAPNNDEAVSSLVQALADEGKLDAARQEIDALPAAARTAQVYATLGSAYQTRRQYAQAAEAYKQAVALAADDPAMQRDYAQSLMDSGDFKGALDAFQQVVRQNPSDGRSMIRVAQLQQQLGQYPQAEQSLQTASDLLPGDLEVGFTSAQLNQSEGHTDKAIAGFKQLLSQTVRPDGKYSDGMRNNRSLFFDQLGALQLQTGDYSGALATYQQMAALGPASTAARAVQHEIEAYSGSGDYAKATALAQSALQTDPQSRALHVTYANLLAATGQTDAAVAQLQPLLQNAPTDWDLDLVLGQIHEQARQWPQAEASATQAAQLAPDDAARAQAAVLAGSVAQKQTHFADAEASYRRALVLAPGDASVLNSLGYLLADQGVRLPEALGYIQQALQHDPNNGAYLDSLGWVYFKMNRPADAVANLQRAASLERNDPTVLDHLAQAYQAAGQLQQAAASWQQEITLWKSGPAGQFDQQKADAAQKQLDAVKLRQAQTGGSTH